MRAEERGERAVKGEKRESREERAEKRESREESEQRERAEKRGSRGERAESLTIPHSVVYKLRIRPVEDRGQDPTVVTVQALGEIRRSLL